MKKLLLIAIVCLSACITKQNRFQINDTVCFKLNGALGVVHWYSRPISIDPVQETSYTIQAVDNMNRFYKVGVYESQLQECKEKN